MTRSSEIAARAATAYAAAQAQHDARVASADNVTAAAAAAAAVARRRRPITAVNKKKIGNSI
jgi:hypothetical protein